MGDRLHASYTALAARLDARITALRPSLTRVACHGDCHGVNNVMSDGPDGTRVASFFNFDEARLTRRRRCIAGYRSVRPLAQLDFDAIAVFLAVRQFWIMGETAGRHATWGTQTMPTSQLRQVLEVMKYWETFATPQ